MRRVKYGLAENEYVVLSHVKGLSSVLADHPLGTTLYWSPVLRDAVDITSSGAREL